VAGTALDIDPLSDVTQPRYPAVAYNSARSEMLVVWQRLVGGTYDIYGQRVHMLAGGGYHAESSIFLILNFVKDLKNPVVAALPQPAGMGQYLVVGEYQYDVASWPYDRDLYGQRVAGDGTLTDSYLSIATSTRDEANPAVAGSANGQEYLVAWSEVYMDQYIEARSVSAGAVLGPLTQLWVYFAYYHYPAVAAGPLGDYLVTCDSYESPIYPTEIFGWLWGTRLYLPLILRQ
jgi:hypothetical protein